MNKITFLILFLPFSIFAQQINIKGKIKDNQNRGIQSASVSIIDDSENNLGYNYSDEDGNYSITFDKPNSEKITIEVSCLGYHKKIQSFNIKSNIIQNFVIEDKTESLQEVVIDSNKKIKINMPIRYLYYC